MRKALVGAAVTAVFVAPAATGGATPLYFMSPNVEHVAHIPLNNDAAGARIVGDNLYVTTSRDLKIYDVSAPEAPRQVGSLVLPQMPYFAEEDVDTNGRILLVDGPNGPAATLNVVDVEDETNPRVVGTLDGLDQHTFSCILDCRYAYGSRGAVVDLRDPTAPDLVGDWRTHTPLAGTGAAHDVTEVAPGLVVTSSRPLMLLDARRDPRRPRVLALGDHPFEERFGNFWLVHGNEWPRRARDAFLLTSGEAAGPSCDQGAAAFMVWDASRWRASGFEVVGEYRPRSGLPTEGRAPADLFCSHWFDAHPRFHDGGLVAIGWYDHGVRFLDVTRRGTVEEVGYFMAPGGSMSAAYWATDRVVYAVDYHRGLDVLRFTAD